MKYAGYLFMLIIIIGYLLLTVASYYRDKQPSSLHNKKKE